MRQKCFHITIDSPDSIIDAPPHIQNTKLMFKLIKHPEMKYPNKTKFWILLIGNIKRNNSIIISWLLLSF